MESTAINSTDFRITSERDEDVQRFYASFNDKLEYLPANLGETFPNLTELHANVCAIKEISKENFEGLNQLRELHLNFNQIESIDNDTFEFIPAVERINLCE